MASCSPRALTTARSGSGPADRRPACDALAARRAWSPDGAHVVAASNDSRQTTYARGTWNWCASPVETIAEFAARHVPFRLRGASIARSKRLGPMFIWHANQLLPHD
jgi:hypothetical protein